MGMEISGFFSVLDLGIPLAWYGKALGIGIEW
jgi:hypothetical protein